MSDEQLFSVIDSAVSNELKKANKFTTRATIHLRVLKRIMDYLDISTSMISEIKSCIYLEKEIVQLIERCWSSQKTEENQDEFQKLLAKDYIKSFEMTKFINVLYRRETKQKEPAVQKIYKILGMDGFLGDDMKRYVEYLKYSSDDYKSVHVRAVRELYDNNITDFKKIHRVLCAAYGWHTIENEDEIDMKNKYFNLVGSDFEKIMDWKLKQNQDKPPRKHKTLKKRNRLSDSSESEHEDM